MIRLDISSLVFYYTLFSAVAILIIWVAVVYKRAGKNYGKEVDYIWRCSVCSNTYIDSKHEDISTCPLCGSYNKKTK